MKENRLSFLDSGNILGLEEVKQKIKSVLNSKGNDDEDQAEEGCNHWGWGDGGSCNHWGFGN